MIAINKYVNFDDTSIHMPIIIGYCCVQIVTLILSIIIHLRINKENSQTPVTTVASLGQPSTTMTQSEYDKTQLKQIFTKLIMGNVIAAVAYFKFDAIRIFMFQGAMAPITLYADPLIKIYILGQVVKRPFEAEQNPLGSWLQQKAEDLKENVEKIKDETKNETKTEVIEGVKFEEIKDVKVEKIETKEEKLETKEEIIKNVEDVKDVKVENVKEEKVEKKETKKEKKAKKEEKKQEAKQEVKQEIKEEIKEEKKEEFKSDVDDFEEILSKSIEQKDSKSKSKSKKPKKI
jgi:flagellar biosynthesis GTPase FlhF